MVLFAKSNNKFDISISVIFKFHCSSWTHVCSTTFCGRVQLAQRNIENVAASCSPRNVSWFWCTSIYLGLVFQNERQILLSTYMTLASIPSLPSLPPSLPRLLLECIPSWPPPLLQFQYLRNHKNPSTMSHFTKANLILSRQPMCSAWDNDGCCSTC